MNSYIDAQCRHMVAMTDTFTNACLLAARKDDGVISKEEERTLKMINVATEQFKKSLNKIMQKLS